MEKNIPLIKCFGWLIVHQVENISTRVTIFFFLHFLLVRLSERYFAVLLA
jgi:hypothetical protein